MIKSFLRLTYPPWKLKYFKILPKMQTHKRTRKVQIVAKKLQNCKLFWKLSFFDWILHGDNYCIFCSSDLKTLLLGLKKLRLQKLFCVFFCIICNCEKKIENVVATFQKLLTLDKVRVWLYQKSKNWRLHANLKLDRMKNIDLKSGSGVCLYASCPINHDFPTRGKIDLNFKNNNKIF